MGCDIHSKIEVKKDGKWQLNTVPLFDHSWRDEETDMQPDWADGRHYDWFSILADVRNGRGFAGIETGEGFIPIAEPRGVPEDATPEWKKYVEDWGYDIHSTSWLTLPDFDNYNWDRRSKKKGVIRLNAYKELAGTNKSPDSWCGSVSGGNIVTISMAEADKVSAGEEALRRIYKDTFLGPRTYTDQLVSIRQGKEIYVSYEWIIDYRDWFADKLKANVEPLRQLLTDFEDVRVVFGFDN